MRARVSPARGPLRSCSRAARPAAGISTKVKFVEPLDFVQFPFVNFIHLTPGGGGVILTYIMCPELFEVILLHNTLRVGLDIGSTTLKAVVLDGGEIVYEKYERHFSMITEKAAVMLRDIAGAVGEREVLFAISGSAGMGLADRLGLAFQQEVYATRRAVETVLGEADAVIELGGEDAKILFLTNRGRRDLEVRMNGSCAGGTGAFIDQMATLLDITPDEMNRLAANYDKLYSIASRCGVFAKSDIQPLLNQGAKKENISASIFASVVNQTIAGLAQGRKIAGRVVYLGGPLTFLPELRASFDRILGLTGICPEHSLYFVARGAAELAREPVDLSELIETLERTEPSRGYQSCHPLFANEDEYRAFQTRHAAAKVETIPDEGYTGRAYLGVDAGSTTVKAVLIREDEKILYTEYLPNGGNPVPLVKRFLETIYERFPNLTLAGAASTGYGEDMIKNAFCFDSSLVETMAHFAAARKFQPDVDFIIDIGGQDIKCFKIRNGAIDNIFLNEACSSGCGSFLQTFAGALGYDIASFAKLGVLAGRPVDLGSRCTVFMNSSVKQAQKDGAAIENISAGLSISVVKNALYKVIRAANADSLGKHIVVQGGTFHNDAVLRAFEQELGRDVTRPNIAGLMGAYGAALHAKRNASGGASGVLNAEALKNFRHETKNTTCRGCANHCSLTVNTFDGGRRFIGGNRCEKPTAKQGKAVKLSLYDYKRELLASYLPKPGRWGKLGIPLGLNLFELYPFYYTFFTELGFEVLHSPESSRELYLLGQSTISSDTACYPAKLMHGHIQALIDQGIDTIFYPCMSYNIDEHKGTNHYNCPVVAYYPEVIRANMPDIKKIRFISDYLGIHDPKQFVRRIMEILPRHFPGLTKKEVKRAAGLAYAAYQSFMDKIHKKGAEYLRMAKEQNLPCVVLAGRPYHLDTEVNHGIDQLVGELGAVVVSEDAVAWQEEKFPVSVLNQWTYHTRLYAAAKYVAESGDPNLNLVQLVSFGCGVDAITTDEVRSILEEKGKIYTQIKIDEITNLGAVRIRLRSLFAALQNITSGDNV